jgi:hypothetical protein
LVPWSSYDQFSGAGTAYPSGSPDFTPRFLWGYMKATYFKYSYQLYKEEKYLRKIIFMVEICHDRVIGK